MLATLEVRDLHEKIAQASVSNGADLQRLESDFVKVVKRLGENRGIGYGARPDACSCAVLECAGVARTRG